MDLLAVASGATREAFVVLAAEGEAGAGLAINFFWIIVSSLNFLIFLALLYVFALGPVRRMLDDRRTRIEQGLKDAEQARRERDAAEQERIGVLVEARREANDIFNRAQKIAQETREADIAATKEELERMRTRATAEIGAEKQRAIADLRAEVADLAIAAAGKIVGESMTDDRQRRLVEEFLREAPARGSSS